MTSAPAPLSVVIVHGVLDALRPDEQDTLVQVEQVSAALGRLGHRVSIMSVGLDLSVLERIAPDAVVFNLVEALRGDGRLIHLVPAALEHLSRAFTGTGSAAMLASSSKVMSKTVLAAAGLRVPRTITGNEALSAADRFIVKSVWEDASFGMDADSVVTGDRVESEIAARRARFGGEWLAEEFLEGREFNISVLGSGVSARVLPPAEIGFRDFPADKPRIVDYEAKWDPTSFAYHNTPRRFLDAAMEPALVAILVETARRAYAAMDLRDYGRVDIRLAADGEPVVLEVNANPCLAADAGFAAAAAEAGLGYDAMIAAIVAMGVRHSGSDTSTGRGSDVSPQPRDKVSDPEGQTPHTRESGIRRHVTPADTARIRDIVTATGFFTEDEIAIAAELVDERLAKGLASGYEFVLIEEEGRLLAYTCYGLVPGSDISWDLYWIAVDPARQGQGLGRRVLAETERLVRDAGGRKLYADTSSSPRYAPTRAYYRAAGFREAARLDDFYRAGDGKVIYEKDL